MPHQCVRCGKFYNDGSERILKGCSCGSKLFFFVRENQVKKAETIAQQLTKEDKKQIEKDAYDIIGAKPEEHQPVILDLESIQIKSPGKFEIDIVKLFDKSKPLVYKLEEGKYMVDIAETFMRRNTNDSEEKID